MKITTLKNQAGVLILCMHLHFHVAAVSPALQGEGFGKYVPGILHHALHPAVVPSWKADLDDMGQDVIAKVDGRILTGLQSETVGAVLIEEAEAALQTFG